MGQITKALSGVFGTVLDRAAKDVSFAAEIELRWLCLVNEQRKHVGLPVNDRMREEDLQRLLIRALNAVLQAERNRQGGQT